jgi:hypothetical protein
MDKDMPTHLSDPIAQKVDMDTVTALLESSVEISWLDLSGSTVHMVRHPRYGSLALVLTPSGECAAIRIAD